MIRTVLFGFLALGLWLSAAATAAIENPQQLVRETADTVLAELTGRKDELEANPALIYPLVEETILPHFDFRRMTQSALGRFWRDTTDAQREALVGEFRELLVRTYATALLGYSGQTIEYLPTTIRADESRVTIPTRIASGGAPPIPINYRLQRTDGTWLVYDVVIDGVSLITNYRSQFAGVVRRQGVDGLVDVLASKNRSIGQ